MYITSIRNADGTYTHTFDVQTEPRPVPGTEDLPEQERQFFGTYPPNDGWEYLDITETGDSDFRWMRARQLGGRWGDDAEKIAN